MKSPILEIKHEGDNAVIIADVGIDVFAILNEVRPYIREIDNEFRRQNPRVSLLPHQDFDLFAMAQIIDDINSDVADGKAPRPSTAEMMIAMIVGEYSASCDAINLAPNRDELIDNILSRFSGLN